MSEFNPLAYKIALGGAIAAIALGASDQAAAADACPHPNRIKQVSNECHDYLRGILHKSVYDDVSESLAVAAYQKVTGGLSVDGSIGPMTARSILQGKGLHPNSPDPHSHGKELLVKNSEQNMYDLKSGRLMHVFKIASGTEKKYVDRGSDGKIHKGTADTPAGTYKIYDIEGANYKVALGAMPDAHYFDPKQGLAIHGGVVTVKGKLSHGCVHADEKVMQKYINKEDGIGTTVKVVK